MKRIIAVFISFSMLLISAYSEEYVDCFIEMSLDLKTGETTVIEKDITSEKDFSNLLVTVTEITPDGIASNIYTGPLSGYDNGYWTNVDFSDKKPFLIYDWQTKSTFWIIPSEESNTTSTLSLEGDLASESPELTIASQIRINGVNVGENGLRIVDNANVSCSFSVSNNLNTDRKITVLLATYTDTGALHNVSALDIEIDAQATKNTELTYQFDAEKEHTGKLFFWDSLLTLIPVRTAIDFSQESGVNAYYYNADNRLLQVDKVNGTSILYTYDNMGNLLTRTIRK